MLKLRIPGFKDVDIEHLVLDYNGTLAADGYLLPRIADLLAELADHVTLHVLTADTHGQARVALLQAGLPEPVILDRDDPRPEDVRKAAYVRERGPDRTVAIGNGRNDRLMLKEATLGI